MIRLLLDPPPDTEIPPARASLADSMVTCVPSLVPLLDFWQRAAQEDDPKIPGAVALWARISAHPELRQPVTAELIERHRSLIEEILSCVFPRALQSFSFAAVATPGTFDVHWATPRFHRELIVEGQLAASFALGGMEWNELRKLFHYLLVARTFYDLDAHFQKSVILEKTNPQNGLKQYFQMRAHFEHVRLLGPEHITPLSPQQRSKLLTQLHNLDLWAEMIPLGDFRMEGLVVYEALEITDEMTLAAITEVLVSRNCLLNPERFEDLQLNIGQLLSVGDLKMTVGAFHLDRVLVFRGQAETDLAGCQLEECLGARQFLQTGQPLAIHQLDCPVACPPELHQHPLVEEALEEGAWSLVVLPLRHEGCILGFVSLTSKTPGSLNSLTPTRLLGVLPQLGLAVQRSLETIDHRVDRMMKESFTAIHEAVEWRFKEQALGIVRGVAASEDIVFADVYPLFGSSDVRHSTVTRNLATQADMKEQLSLSLAVLQSANQKSDLPFVRSRIFLAQRWLGRLEQPLQSGDEGRIHEFLKKEFEPLLDRLAEFGESAAQAVARYRDSLDPKLGIVHRQRKAFENSMALIRDCISEILNQAEQKAQATFPHYFEVHKTDGIDHTLYIGSSLCQNRDFDPLFLKNLRLWQLETMIEVVRAADALVPQLPMPLETAHLILVQDSPLSIRYGLEEKHFDVDGAYNARYEILKKRIDKAEVLGRFDPAGPGETPRLQRLTQPGMLAIIYSHSREKAEYMDYLEFLRETQALSGSIEDLEIAPLQGVQGLRALRLQIR